MMTDERGLAISPRLPGNPASSMRPLSRRLWSRDTFCVAFVLMLSVCVIYSPVLQVDYLYWDDYIFFTRPKDWTLTVIELPHARPLLGVFVDVLNTSVVTGAGTKRLVSVLGLGLLACLVYAWLRRVWLACAHGRALEPFVVLSPAFQTTASYLTVTGSIYAAVFSCGSPRLLSRRRKSDSPKSRRIRFYRMLLTSVLLFTALSCYQPGAMFCWAILIVPVYLRATTTGHRLAWHCCDLIDLCFHAGPHLLFYKAVLLWQRSRSAPDRSGPIPPNRREADMVLHLFPSVYRRRGDTVVP
jgi:hypothetical protein